MLDEDDVDEDDLGFDLAGDKKSKKKKRRSSSASSKEETNTGKIRALQKTLQDKLDNLKIDESTTKKRLRMKRWCKLLELFIARCDY